MSGALQSGSPWIGGSAPLIGEGWVQFGGPAGKKVYWDQLSKADQDLVIQYLLSAQFPQLSPPQAVTASGDGDGQIIGGVSAASVAAMVDQSQHEIIMSMLNSWLVNIQEQAERNKREEEKRTIVGMSVAYQTFQHEVNVKSDSMVPLFAVGMIVAGTGILQSTVTTPPTGGLEFNPVLDMYNQVIVPVTGDMRAELGLIGAIFAAGVQYFTIAQIASSSAVGTKPKDGAFAKGYAENIVSLVGTNSFNQYITALVVRGASTSEPLSEDRIKELTAMIKLVLLSSALTMLYKAEAGKMTSEEFVGMLQGEIAFEEGDVRATLVGLINAHLNQLSPRFREKVLISLLEYLDSDPSIDTLAEPAKVLAGIQRNLPRGDLAG